MDATIDFKPDQLLELITEIESIDIGACNTGSKKPDTCGSAGASMTALADIDNQYNQLASSMKNLFDSTAEFLKKARESMTSTDDAMSHQFK
ncbi:hypothetical protein PT279_00350 [Bifidobacterium sp. ESL0784]|uniref:hypothetical protein n=1 Tax=Bifidobacterium sp. ESL0784 TaxID=2983231 RepID=UPI0023F84D49|nr:hypothetical protein [Bifidobacterium sp. ESL0784]MDF7640056.1 hypothetical protein [Bifidobacterium sp. ESL0784]